MAKQLSWQSRGRKVRVAFLATSRFVPPHFHADGSKVGIEPAHPQAAHGSVLGARGLAGLHFMAAPKTMSFSPRAPC